MHDSIKLYRKRFIPYEIIHLKDDKILFFSEDLIITKWCALKPRPDISKGISAYFMDKGFKLSKIYNSMNQVVYWYCDIILTKKDINNHNIIFDDLLVDVIIYENGSIKVVDIGELADALEQKLIDVQVATLALQNLSSLLDIIYSGDLQIYQKYINDIE